MSSYKYTLEAEMMENLAVHLTNNAIQKKDQAYGKFEDGNQLTYKQASVSKLFIYLSQAETGFDISEFV